MPTRVLRNTAPLTCLLNEKPDYTFLRAFGCAYAGRTSAHTIIVNSIFVPDSAIFVPDSAYSWAIALCTKATSALIDQLAVFIFPATLFLMKNFFLLQPHLPLLPTTTPILPTPPSVFPVAEPAVVDDRMQRYDLILLTNASSSPSDVHAGSSDSTSSGSTSPRTPHHHHADGPAPTFPVLPSGS